MIRWFTIVFFSIARILFGTKFCVIGLFGDDDTHTHIHPFGYRLLTQYSWFST